MFLRRSLIMLASLLLPLSASLVSGAAQAQPTASDCQGKVDAERALAVVNAFRAEPRVCGQKSFAAAGPLRWEARLERAACDHASELAQGDQLNHVGANGRSLRERVRGEGYLAWRVGENLAAGQENLDEVLQTWITSAAHCENLMQPEFQDVVLACASGPGKFGRYWVMNLGRPVRD